MCLLVEHEGQPCIKLPNEILCAWHDHPQFGTNFKERCAEWVPTLDMRFALNLEVIILNFHVLIHFDFHDCTIIW